MIAGRDAPTFANASANILAGATLRLIRVAKNVAYHNATAFDRKQGEGTGESRPNRTVTVGMGSNRWRSSHEVFAPDLQGQQV